MNEELLPTEYVEDGFVYEVEYKQSAVLQRLTEMLKEGREGFIKRMWMIHDLTDMANSAVKNARKASPLGLVDKCVEKRIDGKQKAYGYAGSAFCKEHYPKLFKTLFRINDVLYNTCMACAICAFDEMYRWMDGDKETKPLMLSGEEIDAVIQSNSRPKGLKL
jgi:hypothetical protein